MIPVSDPAHGTRRPRLTGLVLLALLLMAGQWQISWHAMFHLPDAVIEAGAPDHTPAGHGHATGHCDDCAPVQLAVLSHQSTPASVNPAPGWLMDTGRPGHDTTPLRAYHSRAPPHSA